MSPYQIQRARAFQAVSPLSQPIADATHEIPEIRVVVVEVELASGVTGQGYLLAFHYNRRAIAGAIHDVCDRATDYAAHETARLAADHAREAEYFGVEGLLQWATAALNLAMWDAWGRAVGQPVWRLLGGHRRAIPIYGSGGWLSYSDDELVDEVRDYAARGFRAVKIKVGAREAGRDLHRLQLVREAVGTGVEVMMDANQGMDVAGALALARAAEPLGIQWFEEPLPRTDVAGYATLRQRAGVALAMGEREYGTDVLRALAAHHALDLWQPDVVRLGGVEGWRDSAAVAAALHLPVLPHYYKDYDVPLLCTVARPHGAESFDWIDPLIDRPLAIEDGVAYPREEPGWGFSFLHEHLSELP